MNLQFLKDNPQILSTLITKMFRLDEHVDVNRINVEWYASVGLNHTVGSNHYHSCPPQIELVEGQNLNKNILHIGRLWGNWQITAGAPIDPVLTLTSPVDKTILLLDPEDFDTSAGLGVMPIDYDCVFFKQAICAHGTHADPTTHLNFHGLKVTW